LRRFQVKFARSGRTIDIPEDGVILQHALRAGIPLSYSCQAGVCGSCMAAVQGEVVQWGRCIDDGQKTAGFVLLCSAYPCSDLIIDA